MYLTLNDLKQQLEPSMGFRERRVIEALDAKLSGANGYPGCVKVPAKSVPGDNTFVVRLRDFAIVN